jgi:CHAT domain-containing protein
MNPNRMILILTLWLIARLSTYGQNAADPTYRQDPSILLGDSLFIFENFTGAQAAYLQSLRTMEKQKDMAGSLYAITRLARTAIEMKDPVKAMGYLKRADRIGKEHASLYLERGITLKEWAVYYDQSGQDSLAGSYFELSLEMLESCCIDQVEILGEVHLEHAKYLHYKELGISEELVRMAINHFREDAGIWDLKLADAYNFYGGLLRERGETELRSSYIRAAAQILDKYESPPLGLALNNVYFNIAIQAFDERHFAEAAGMFQRIITLGMNAYGPGWRNLYVNEAMLGSALVELNDPQAFTILKDAEKNHARLSQPNWVNLGYIHYVLGKHYVNRNRLDSARFYFNSAIEKYSTASASSYLSDLYQDLARMSLQEGSPRQALEYSDLSLQYAGYRDQEVFDPSVLESENIDLYFDPMELRGRIFLALFEQTQDTSTLHKAQKIYDQIEKIAEFTRNGSYTEETKQIVSVMFHHSARGALNVLTTLNQWSPKREYVVSAFNFMEHNRYAQLFQDLNRSRAFSSLSSNDSIYQRWRFFVTEINKLKLKITEAERQNLAYRQFADSLIRLQDAFQLFKAGLKESHPGVYQIRYDSMLSLDEIQEKIDPGTQLFEFFWGDSAVSLVTLTQNTALLVSLPLSEIKPELDRLLPWLVSDYPADSLSLRYTEFAWLTHRLYQVLLYRWLQQPVNRLLISADGPLAYLPFDILITDTAEIQGGFSSAPYLIRQQDIQYVYSSNLLFKHPAPGTSQNPRVLAMAYSTEEDDAKAMSHQGYREIPHSALEIEAIRKRFNRANVTGLVGTEATKTAFLSLSPAYDIIHLALHGLADTVSSLGSHLIFRSSPDTDDGRLFAHELYNLSSPGWRLVVLSACETGVGKAYAGEGIFSIARGFAYTGTPALVMSLWKANDQTTEWMMDHFYRHLNRGVPVSKAMQLAKIDFLDQVNPDEALPYYWAGFVVMGDSDVIVPIPCPWIYLIAAVIFYIILYYLIRQFSLRRKYKSTQRI